MDEFAKVFYKVAISYYNRGVGTGPAGPAIAGPKFPEPTIKNNLLYLYL